MSIAYQNLSGHPQFSNIVARLNPIAEELSELLAERRIEAFLAIGSIPAGYEAPDSDLDLLAFTATAPRYIHYFARNRINIRETDWAHLRRELEVCPAISLAPMTLAVLPYAMLYVQPDRATDFLAALNDIRLACLAHILNEVRGEIRYGQRRTAALNAEVSVNPADVLGYWIMFTSLTNPQLAAKLDRMCTRPPCAETASQVQLAVTADWIRRDNELCLAACSADLAISYRRFWWRCIQTAWCRFQPSSAMQTLFWREGQEHYRLHGQIVHQTLPVQRWRFAQSLRLLGQTLQTLNRSAIRLRYGCLASGPTGLRYDGLGCLARSQPY